MAFEDRDTSIRRTRKVETSTESVMYQRNRDTEDGAPPLQIIVTKRVDGQLVDLRVPRDKILEGWPGTSKTLKAHLLWAQDNAE